ncbi:MAG: hypothetical protein IJG15_07095 [Lachnospiraceae bacterium]|nr:hypothetical protein [Lachnospiraceae bacterium]
MSALMFPKKPARKRGRAHARHSILQADTDRRRCWLCMRMHDYSEKISLHKHHVYEGTALRRISEAEGFFVWLCPQHHEFGPMSAHTDIGVRRSLQKEAQREYEKHHTREEFMRLVGRSYL